MPILQFIKKYRLLIILIFAPACVRRINPPIRQGQPILVVEGTLTTDSLPYIVKLSYTGKFTNASTSVDTNQNFINDAVVVIKDIQGDSSLCNLIAPGTYQSADSNFIGVVGNTYTLEIRLSNGKTYVSVPEKIYPVAPIDSISVRYDSSYITDVRPTEFIISANTKDPLNAVNFYRWTAFGYVPRKSWGGPCFISDPPCTNPFMCLCHAECEQLLNNNEVNVLSDQLINGKEIIQPVFYSPIYWFGNHYIEVKEYSISQDIYEFWQQYLEQTNRTGSILDPLPASLIGNIHNPSDSNEVVLGYFQASAVATKQVIIEPFFLQEYYLESLVGEYTPMGDCHEVFPNSLDDDTAPLGWENAQLIELH